MIDGFAAFLSGGFEAKSNLLRRASFLALSLVLASLLTAGAIPASIADPLLRAATPTFSPASGTYTSPQNITINCTTQGSTIRYTLDGSTPTYTSPIYSKPIFLNATTTVKAIATASRYRDSDVATATYTINLPKVATPTFNPQGGTYNSAQSVVVQCATQGATIRYTTNGAEPSTSSTVYSSPISVSTSITLKAKAFRTDWLDSNTASATYVIKVATPTFSPVGGTYTSPQTVTIQCATVGATIRYTTDGSVPSSLSPVFPSSVTVSVSSTVRAKAFMSGMVDSDTANATYIINIPKVATPTFSPAGGTYSSPQNVVIKCPTVGATIRYTTDGSVPSSSSPVFSVSIMVSVSSTVRARAFMSGMVDSDVASATYIINIPKVATPLFSPPGGNYSAFQNVTLSCATSGATIRYTRDGSDPNLVSIVYISPISVNSTTTIKAKAFMTGMTDSDTATAVYTITIPKVATPTFNPPGGNYSSYQNVTLTCATTGAVIRYTTDGSDPTSVSTTYYTSIQVNATTTIKAKAFMTGMTDSDTVGATYIIMISSVATPTFSPSSGSYNSAQTVSIACSTPGATIRFTVDGSNPVSSSTAYSAPITVTTNMTVRARAFIAGWTDSDMAMATYVIVILPPPNVAMPTFSPGAGNYVLSATVTIDCATAEATVRYTTDGSEPSAASATYSVPVLVNSNITLKAKAFKAGLTDSDTATAIYTITIPKVATPTIAPGAGTYSTAQTVSLSCSTAGATIRFTIDGSNPSSSSAAYSTPIAVAANLTVKARAFVAGWADSDVATATYVILVLVPAKVAAPVFDPLGGSYSLSQNVTLSCSSAGATIRFTSDGSNPGSLSAAYSSPIRVNSTMTIKARAFMSGMIDSDTATATYIIAGVPGTTNATTKVATPTFTPVAGTYSSSQNVEVGCATSGATIRFTVDGSEPSSSSAIYSTPIVVRATTTVKAKGFVAGMNDSDTATATYTITAVGGKVATPSFDPWGGDYSSAQTVTIQCATAGAIIRYTTNGDQPSFSSAVYSGPISVNVTTTLKARAFLDGMTDSDTASTTYSIDLERGASANPFLGGGLVYPLVAVVGVVALVGGALLLKFGRISGKAKKIEVELPSDVPKQLQPAPLPVSVEPEQSESLPPVGTVKEPAPKPESIDLKGVEPHPLSSSIQQPVPVVAASQPVAHEILRCPSCGRECSKKEYDDGLCWRCELLEFEKRCSR